MDHHVFRDLAPAYIEQLTSTETTKQIEEHLKQCEACRAYLNEMKKDFLRDCENERKKERYQIDYFKKVRSKNRKKIWVTVSSVVAVFLILITVYYFLFVNMSLAEKDDVRTDIQQQDQTVTVSFQSEKSSHYLLAQDVLTDEGFVGTIFVYEKRNDFSNAAKSLKDGITYTYTFINENTLRLSNGETYAIKDDDKVSIHYNDHVEEIYLKDLFDQ